VQYSLSGNNFLIAEDPWGDDDGCYNAAYTSENNDGIKGDWEFVGYERKSNPKEDCDDHYNFYAKGNGIASYSQKLIISDSTIQQIEEVEATCLAEMYPFKADEAQKATSCNSWQDRSLFSGSMYYESYEYKDGKLLVTIRHTLEAYDCSYTYVRGEGVTEEEVCSTEYENYMKCKEALEAREEEIDAENNG
jgi:hypothetical protein